MMVLSAKVKRIIEWKGEQLRTRMILDSRRLFLNNVKPFLRRLNLHSANYL
jgi:hypothetical protein